jgi:hypothetical protein
VHPAQHFEAMLHCDFYIHKQYSIAATYWWRVENYRRALLKWAGSGVAFQVLG